MITKQKEMITKQKELRRKLVELKDAGVITSANFEKVDGVECQYSAWIEHTHKDWSAHYPEWVRASECKAGSHPEPTSPKTLYQHRLAESRERAAAEDASRPKGSPWEWL